MNVAIVGSREASPLMMVNIRQYIDALPPDTVIISGGARGVDTAAEATAKSIGLKTVVLRADWDKHGKGAGMIRNREIVNRADLVVAFWDGQSRGTKNTIDYALQANHIKRVTVYKY